MLLDKQSMPMVAMECMNEVHGEDIDIINELYELVLKYEQSQTPQNKEAIDQKYNEWTSHTIEHFKNEEKMMLEKNFGPYLFHKSEHDSTLALMNKVFKDWQQNGDIKVFKNYFTDTLPNWLVNHIKTMDTVTAIFLKTGFSSCSKGMNSLRI